MSGGGALGGEGTTARALWPQHVAHAVQCTPTAGARRSRAAAPLLCPTPVPSPRPPPRRYFYIPCRKEHRGIGGLFFDDVSSGEAGYDAEVRPSPSLPPMTIEP